ncbi:calcium-dependent phosphotriesterase [Hypoxylon cercidicola]|nr:calcium-dependent phosphotriesterase [Hypoxylon cercidicola]
MASFLYVTTIVVGALFALLYPPLKHTATVMGLFRPLHSWQNLHGMENHFIDGTIACEDLHYHEHSAMLYSACAGNAEKAAGWFPGAGSLDHPENPPYGTLVVINPKTLTSQKLSLTNFEGPFVTHGISIYSPPSDLETVYIYAVNHLPNPLWTPSSPEQPKAASRIELFVHTVGSNTAEHLRSISHPLIRTPNDLLALSEHEFLVTNDHYYRDGFMRLVEEMSYLSWTDVVHVRLDDAANASASVSLNSIPTNNGLGWGPNQQVLISNPVGGDLYFSRLEGGYNKTLSVTHSIRADGVVDNPSFFSDPWAGLDGKDYSGYLLPGIGRPIDLATNYKDPAGKAPLASIVWYLPVAAGEKEGASEATKPTLLFADDGSSLRGATTAVIVGIDPATNEGKREGWLFVTGVIAPHMIATKIDFATALSSGVE